MELDLLAGQLLEVETKPVCFCSATSDEDARASNVKIDTNFFTGSLDLDARYASALHLGVHNLADHHIFFDIILVEFFWVPTRRVLSGDTEAEAVASIFCPIYSVNSSPVLAGAVADADAKAEANAKARIEVSQKAIEQAEAKTAAERKAKQETEACARRANYDIRCGTIES